MKNIKNWVACITAAILATVALLVSTTGCVSTTTVTNGVTNTVKQVDVDKTAIALKTATWGGLSVVIQKNPTSAPPYIQLASTTLTEFIGGSNYTPGALSAAIQKLPQGSLKKPEVAYAILSVTAAYELAYADYVQGIVGGDTNALKLLTAVRDGCDLALKGAITAQQ